MSGWCVRWPGSIGPFFFWQALLYGFEVLKPIFDNSLFDVVLGDDHRAYKDRLDRFCSVGNRDGILDGRARRQIHGSFRSGSGLQSDGFIDGHRLGAI